jgi:hypothetical protein
MFDLSHPAEDLNQQGQNGGRKGSRKILRYTESRVKEPHKCYAKGYWNSL